MCDSDNRLHAAGLAGTRLRHAQPPQGGNWTEPRIPPSCTSTAAHHSWTGTVGCAKRFTICTQLTMLATLSWSHPSTTWSQLEKQMSRDVLVQLYVCLHVWHTYEYVSLHDIISQMSAVYASTVQQCHTYIHTYIHTYMTYIHTSLTYIHTSSPPFATYNLHILCT
jgi:hypothetical protein